jgi:hypothetical protein
MSAPLSPDVPSEHECNEYYSEELNHDGFPSIPLVLVFQMSARPPKKALVPSGLAIMSASMTPAATITKRLITLAPIISLLSVWQSEFAVVVSGAGRRGTGRSASFILSGLESQANEKSNSDDGSYAIVKYSSDQTKQPECN